MSGYISAKPADLKELLMILIPVRCPNCNSEAVVKRGKTDNGKQRYSCQTGACFHRTFILEYSYRGRLPTVKQQLIDMSLNGSGIRDIARVLRISTDPLPFSGN